MKTLTALMLGLGLTVSAFATNAASFAVVDLPKVYENSTYLNQQNASLTQSIKPTQVRLDQIGKEIEMLEQKAQSANEAQLKTLAVQYKAKVDEFNTTQKGLQSKIQTSLQSSNTIFETRLKQASEQLRKESNVDLILNKNTVVDFYAHLDLTDKMIQKINAIK
ncbi:MAG: OmpH family outer membrane protein [Acinetobacter sp.]